jgi:hypothetical protein
VEAYSEQQFRLLFEDSGNFVITPRAKAGSKVVVTIMGRDIEWGSQRCRNGTGSGVEP